MAETGNAQQEPGQARGQLRAADGDRAVVAERLRNALDEGRLTLAEYDERVRTAYAAVTYADLNTLLSDLPTAGGVLELRPTSQAPAPRIPSPAPAKPPVARRRRRVPLPLMILWTIWGSLVAVNVAVWLIVSVMTGHLLYPWPVWVAGPAGAALLAVTVGVQAIRDSGDHGRSGGDHGGEHGRDGG